VLKISDDPLAYARKIEKRNKELSGNKFSVEVKVDFDERLKPYARILDPDSKQGTFDNLSSYYEQPDFEYVHIPRTVDILQSNY
jgi:hypothetical protein